MGELVLRDALKLLYEVARPLSCNLKGGYHINCPFGYVGRGRVRVVTHGLNLPRHGTETARRNAGFTQSVDWVRVPRRSQANNLSFFVRGVKA